LVLPHWAAPELAGLLKNLSLALLASLPKSIALPCKTCNKRSEAVREAGLPGEGVVSIACESCGVFSIGRVSEEGIL
jgi:hypothetical protein